MFLKVATAMLLGIAFPWQAHAQRTLTYFLEQARQNSTEIEILSPRFKPSDRIIAEGGYGLEDQARIRLKN